MSQIMPELPEVETIRRELAGYVSGQSIVDAWAFPSAKFEPAVLAVGSRIGGVSRRGKYLLVSLDDNRELVIHLGMTGGLFPTAGGRVDDPHVRASWTFASGEGLIFRDVRRFGRLRVVPKGDYSTITTLHRLGPEPLSEDFEKAGFAKALRRSKRRIKTQLLSQIPVAGVGNIYADEALWRARVYPAARSISKQQSDQLHKAIVDVLAAGVANGGTTLRDYRGIDGNEGSNQFHLDCYGRAGQPCPRCSTLLVSQVWDARTTTFCPNCQNR